MSASDLIVMVIAIIHVIPYHLQSVSMSMMSPDSTSISSSNEYPPTPFFPSHHSAYLLLQPLYGHQLQAPVTVDTSIQLHLLFLVFCSWH
jgi:hypothetical protein